MLHICIKMWYWLNNNEHVQSLSLCFRFAPCLSLHCQPVSSVRLSCVHVVLGKRTTRHRCYSGVGDILALLSGFVLFFFCDQEPLAWQIEFPWCSLTPDRMLCKACGSFVVGGFNCCVPFSFCWDGLSEKDTVRLEL